MLCLATGMILTWGCSAESSPREVLREAPLLEPAEPRPIQDAEDVIPPPTEQCLEVPRGGCLDGESCTEDSECAGGTCLRPPVYPYGYCTTLACTNRRDCASLPEVDNRCLIVASGENVCVRLCDTEAESEGSGCRPGYQCQPVEPPRGVCLPADAPESSLEPQDIANYPIPMTCFDVPSEQAVALPFNVAEGTQAFLYAPFTRDGKRVEALGILTPTGRAISFTDRGAFLATPSRLLGTINPVVFPNPADDAYAVEAGQYRYILRSASQQVCGYVVGEDQPGDTIDFNIYPVGVPGLTAEGAAQDEDLAAVLSAFERLYEPVGVDIGTVRYVAVDDETALRFSIVRTTQEAVSLVARSVLPGPTVDDALSLNVFLVRGFASDGVLGVSLGLPGPAGLHGYEASGVVLTTEFLGQTVSNERGDQLEGNILTAQFFAHEVGHYLGLFHTTEVNQEAFDPLDDTPRCTEEGFPAACPDLGNLMFPLAAPINTELTGAQVRVLQSNPLTRRATPLSPAEEE